MTDVVRRSMTCLLIMNGGSDRVEWTLPPEVVCQSWSVVVDTSQALDDLPLLVVEPTVGVPVGQRAAPRLLRAGAPLRTPPSTLCLQKRPAQDLLERQCLRAATLGRNLRYYPAVPPDTKRQSVNYLLNSLTPDAFARVAKRLRRVTLRAKDVVYKPNEPIDHILFPENAIVCLMTVMSNGDTIEAPPWAARARHGSRRASAH